MGTAGSRYGEFRTTLRTGSYKLACNVARDLPHVDLTDALRLTLLAATKDSPERFEALAKRWLIRFSQEQKPSLKLLSWIADDFSNLGDPECPFSEKQRSEGRMAQMLETMQYQP